MHTVYKALAPDNVERIIDYCKDHSVEKGGTFEVYLENEVTMVVVNSEEGQMFRPLGAFYCNYIGPGVISLEDEEPERDSMPSTTNHIKAIKKTIDKLIELAHP